MTESYRFHLERLEQQVGALAAEFTRVQLVRFGPSPRWQPPINAYLCADRFVICVDLAGVDKRAISVRAEPRRLLISGVRPPPEPACDQPQPVQVLAMEIDYGPFERVLNLPAEVDAARVNAEHRDGLLWISLPLRTHS